MVDRIASRKAASSLAKILGLMLLPIVVLGYFYTREAIEDMDFIETEINGLYLVNHAAPLIFKNDANGLAEHATQIKALEAAILRGPSKVSLLDIPAASSTGPQAHALLASSINAYISSVLTESNLILDSDAETYHLIASVLQNLPRAFSARENILRDLEQLLQSRDRDSVQMRNLMQMLGVLQESVRRLQDSLESAQKATKDPGFYGSIANPLSQLSQQSEVLISLFMQAQGTTGEFALRTYLADEKRKSLFTSNALELWKLTSQRVEQRLGSRLSELRYQNVLLTGIGLICSILAIGAAVLMFRRTLVRLDQIEDMQQAEAASRAALEQVNGNIAALNQELSANMQRLEQAQEELVKKDRMEQLGRLTATIAHELRNPLGSVRTSAFLLERKLKDKNLGVESQLERINKGITRCDNIITQLLDYSRTKQVSAKSDNLDVWLARIVEEAAKQLPSVVQIECILGLDDANIPFDASRLERAVINLLNNASEAMVGQGTDSTIFATAAPLLTVKTYKTGHEVVISVADNGPGISPENLAKIREPLFTTKSFGTGLGIPAIEQIAEQHGGRLEIASEPGRGAEFRLFLPTQSMNEAA